MEVPPGDVGGVLHGNQGIGVAGVANHQDLAVAACSLIQGTTLVHEDLAVLLQQVSTLHAGATGLGTNHEAPVSIAELLSGVNANSHLTQQRVQRVLQLHGNAFQGTKGALAAQQLQSHGLVLAIHLTRGKHEQQVVGDVATGSSYCNLDSLLPGACKGRVLVVHVIAEPEHAILGGGRGSSGGSRSCGCSSCCIGPNNNRAPASPDNIAGLALQTKLLLHVERHVRSRLDSHSAQRNLV
mmetsp:Transcript_30914/g.68462  ORF Transcript_30914/g.68462 Transcript_30914/m.68462 type:complete len:240 (-) Transcript_30914:32-751(-)